MNTNNGRLSAPVIEESYQEGLTTVQMDEMIADLVNAGFLIPVISLDERINAWEPYELKISFSSCYAASGSWYTYHLRKLFKSVNLHLRRQIGVTAKLDEHVGKHLQMLQGFIIIQCYGDRPTVEVVCKVNPRHGLIDASSIRNAFMSSGCYQSKANPLPLFDKTTLEVTDLSGGVWDSELADPDAYVFSLTGGRLHREF